MIRVSTINREPEIPVQVRVGVGELYVSRNSNEVLTTYGLGSCVAVAAYDGVACVGGLAHIQLPEHRGPVAGDAESVWAYAEYGVPELISQMYAAGAMRERLNVALAGGATVADPDKYFQIGRKNVLAVKRVLWQHGLIPSRQSVGGTFWRTVKLNVGTGRISIQSPEGYEEL
ncbi:MAG TPA: chemotaxis protein CheD [Planctomycetota bacterium]|jgi:chemotaxis protein CheD